MVTFQKKKQHVLTAVDFDILKLVHEYHFLTVSQVTRLRYSSGSETTCQDRLKRLFKAGVLDRVQLPHVGTGNTQYLYTLSTKGQKELHELGIASFSRFRPSDTHTLKLPHLQHLIALNDFLIAARLLCRANCDIRLVTMLHDLDMKRTPIRVTLDRQTFSIVPDGFLDFRLSIANRLYAMPIWYECDLGTTWGNTLKLKLQKIIAAINVFDNRKMALRHFKCACLLTSSFPVPTVFFEEGWSVKHLLQAGAKKTISDQGLSSSSS